MGRVLAQLHRSLRRLNQKRLLSYDATPLVRLLSLASGQTAEGNEKERDEEEEEGEEGDEEEGDEEEGDEEEGDEVE